MIYCKVISQQLIPWIFYLAPLILSDPSFLPQINLLIENLLFL